MEASSFSIPCQLAIYSSTPRINNFFLTRLWYASDNSSGISERKRIDVCIDTRKIPFSFLSLKLAKTSQDCRLRVVIEMDSFSIINLPEKIIGLKFAILHRENGGVVETILEYCLEKEYRISVCIRRELGLRERERCKEIEKLGKVDFLLSPFAKRGFERWVNWSSFWNGDVRCAPGI